MTREELRERLKRLIHQRDELTDSDLNAMLNDAQVRLARGRFPDADRTGRTLLLRFPDLEVLDTSITLSDGVSSYAYPSTPTRWFEVNHVERQTNATNAQYTELLDTPWQKFGTIDQVRDEMPTHWARYGRKIYVTPRPGSSQAGTVLRTWGYRQPTAMSTDSAEPEFDDAYHALIPILAARDLLYELGEEEQASNLAASFLRRLVETQPTASLRTPRTLSRLRVGGRY